MLFHTLFTKKSRTNHDNIHVLISIMLTDMCIYINARVIYCNVYMLDERDVSMQDEGGLTERV